MTKQYEFSHQSIKQKLVLITFKLMVLLLLGYSIYNLGWSSTSLQDRIADVGSILIWFWIYSNLMQVKVEVQELFVPPFNIKNGAEFLVIGAVFSTTDTLWTIWNIIQLS